MSWHLVNGLTLGLLIAAGTMAQSAAPPAFRPVTQENLGPLKERIVDAAARLDARFNEAGESAGGWQQYLGWARFNELLARPGLPAAKDLQSHYTRFASGEEGLGLVWFADVREAIESYLAASAAVTDPQAQARYSAISDRLGKTLQTYARASNPDEAHWIAGALRWLKDTGQPYSEESLAALRQPNLFITVGEALLDAGMGDQVSEPTTVVDCILGTSLYGNGYTHAAYRVNLVPSEDNAILDMMLTGTVNVNTVGYNRSVQINSVGTTHFSGLKRIWLSPGGVGEFPACSSASVCSQITGICAKCRLVEKIASRKAAEQKPLAEQIAAQHAQARINARMDEQAGPQLARAREQYEAKFRGPLVERRLFPSLLKYFTTEETLEVVSLEAMPDQVAAATAPPAAVAGAELGVRVHESMINNAANAGLAGMTVHEETLRQATIDLLGYVPEELKPDEEGLPWAVTFADGQPITVRFDDNQFQITIRGERYARGENTYPGMYVSATYRIVKEGITIKSVRQGGLQIYPPGTQPGPELKLTGRQVVIRRLLERRFGRILPEEMISKGLDLPGTWKKAGKLYPIALATDNGWMTIGWKR